MSGTIFVDTLKRIGYEDNLCPESFDWMFENEAILPFLLWFCESIHPQNVLTRDELQSFDNMVASGEGVLEVQWNKACEDILLRLVTTSCSKSAAAPQQLGQNLVEALKSMQVQQTEENFEEEINEEIEFMMEEQQCLESKLETLLNQRNKMSILHTELNDKLLKINHMEDEVKSKYKTSLERFHSDNAVLNTSMNNLTKTVKDFIQLYELPQDDKDKAMSSFVSQLPLSDYHNAEEVFTSELTKYTKKQFFEGIAELASGDEKSRYTFLEISDPTTLLIKGEPEDVTTGDIKELKRLQAVYPTSEMKRIHAQAQRHGLQAAISHARESLYRIASRPYAVDVDPLRRSLVESQDDLSRVRERTVDVTTGQLSPLVLELGKLQANKILRGDYDLKIARQDYFISKQDQVINQLMLQRSRYELLSMVYEVEARKHRDSHHLLSAVHTLLEKDAKGNEERHKIMSDPLLRDEKVKRETIDVRDASLMRLYQMLAYSSDDTPAHEKSLFVTIEDLRRRVEKMNGDLTRTQTQLVTVDTNQNEIVAQLEKNLRTYEKLAYGGSATSAGLPQLRTQALSDGFSQLEEVLTTLEQSMRDVIKDCESKKRVLRADSIKTMERELFVFFFTDPSRLKRAVADLTARVEARVVSAD